MMIYLLHSCGQCTIDIPQWYPSHVILVMCWPRCLPGPLHTIVLISCCVLWHSDYKDLKANIVYSTLLNIQSTPTQSKSGNSFMYKDYHFQTWDWKWSLPACLSPRKFCLSSTSAWSSVWEMQTAIFMSSYCLVNVNPSLHIPYISFIESVLIHVRLLRSTECSPYARC